MAWVPQPQILRPAEVAATMQPSTSSGSSIDFILLRMQGALVLAIKDYKGGVLIISHNKDGAVEWIQKRVTRP